MRGWELGRTRGRAAVVVVAAWATAWAGAAAQGAKAGSASAAQTPAPAADPFHFSSDAALMVWTIKADQTDAFESVWSVIRERLSGSPKPELKAMADSLTIFKADAAPAPGAAGITYFMLANPVSKTTSYSVAPYLLFESGLFERPEADELFKMLQSTIVQINPVPLSVVKP
jgi:hypothetical protein